MSRDIRADYDTQYLFPPALEDWVSADHPARFIREFADSLDLREQSFKHHNSLAGGTRDLSYTYDRLHRTLSETYTDSIGIPDKTYNYRYDSASRLIEFADPVYADPALENPKPTLYHFDQDSKQAILERADRLNLKRQDAESYEYQFDDAGRVTRLLMPDWTGESSNSENGYYAFNEYVTAIDYTYFEDGRVKSIHVQKIVQAGDPESVYYIGYSYTTNGWTESMVVKTDPANRPWLYRARYSYDGRGQVVSQKYDYFDTTTKTVKNISDITIRYDLAGNVLQKPMLREGVSGQWTIGFTYDTGYRWTVGTAIFTDLANPLLSKTFTYTPVYDLRGNITNLTITAIGPGTVTSPLDLPSVMKYDAYNRMVEFSVGAGAGLKKWKLKYDPVGRCFRKEEWLGAAPPELEHATHYYYKGSRLVQEFDETPSEFAPYNPVDEIAWDYLRGQDGRVIRRRDASGQQPVDTFHYNDPVGTAKDDGNTKQGGTSRSTNGYVTTAEGEPLSIQGGQPSNVNHIQFHGGFLEGKEWQTALGSGRGNLYRMGVRHYSPALGRFLQRDPLSYRSAPSFSNPKSVNPYVYGMNNANAYLDISGFAPCCGGGSPSTGGHPGGGWIGPGLGNPGTSNPGGSPPDSDCKTPYPKDCWSPYVEECCCEGAGGPEHDSMCNPCGDTVHLSINCLTLDIVKAAECGCWCCAAKNAPEENEPARISMNISGVTVYGPPRIGVGGIAGNRWYFPIKPPQNPPFMLFFASNLQGHLSSNLNQLLFAMEKVIPGGGMIGIECSFSPWGWTATGLGISILNSLIGPGDFCGVDLTKHWGLDCEDDLKKCYEGICCSWFKCEKASKWAGVVFGIWGFMIGGVVGGLPGAIGGASLANGISSLAVKSGCMIQFIQQRDMCNKGKTWGKGCPAPTCP